MLRIQMTRGALVALALAGLLASSCSDDQTDAAATSGVGATTSGATLCAGIAGFDSVSSPGGPTDPTADDMRAYAADVLADVDDIVAGAPDTIHDAVATLQSAIGAAGGGDTSILSDPNLHGAIETIEQTARESCDVTTVDLSATEFAFEGIPDTLPAGQPISFRMTDQGGTTHLMLLAKVPDGTTDDEAFLGDFLGAAFGGSEAFAPFERYDVTGNFPIADAGQTGTALKTLAPGTYVYFCPLPVDPEDPAGPSHYQEGMHGRFTVQA